MYLFRDEQSGLQKIELGAGRTTSDTSVLAWIPIITNQTATVTYQIDVADGERAFIRIRATNNGKCILISFLRKFMYNTFEYTYVYILVREFCYTVYNSH